MCAVRNRPMITGSLAQETQGWFAAGVGTADPVGVHGPLIADFIVLDPQDAQETRFVANDIANP